MRKFTKRSLKAVSAAVIVTLVLTMGLSVFAAATGTTSDSVNVRSTASTSGSIVGTTTAGMTVDVTGEETDSSGQTWYAVTLSNGQTGYIRGDLISVSGTIGDDAAEETTEEDTSEADAQAADAFAQAAQAGSSGTTEATTPQTSDDYQLVYTADENGNDTWYLYFIKEDSRMKISDIEQMSAALQEAQANQSSSSGPFKILFFVALILFIIALVGCILLFLKVRELTSEEVDLARTRDRERRVNKNADAVTIRRGEGNDSRASRERSAAYPSGEGRSARNASGEHRTVAPRSASAERGQSSSAPRRSADGAAVRRTTGSAGTATRESRTVRPESSTVRRTAADGSYRTTRSSEYAGSEQREGSVRRPSSAASSQSAARPASRSSEQPVRRTSSAKNFADADDDMDYGFIGSGKE